MSPRPVPPRRLSAPPPTRFGAAPQQAILDTARVLQRASTVPGGDGASAEFRQSAMRLNTRSDGSQNARIKLVAIDMRHSPPRAHPFEKEHIYYPQTGPHSEQIVMDAALAFVIGLHVPPQNLRLVQVQLYTRFNPCPQCAQGIVNFRDSLLRRARNGTRPPFHLAYTYKTYFGPQGTWTYAEGVFQRQVASTKVRQGGWIVSDGLSQPVVSTYHTLGSSDDPIAVD